VMNSVRIRTGRSNVVRRTLTSISRPSRLHSVFPSLSGSQTPAFLQRDNRQHSAPLLRNSATSVGLGRNDTERARHDTRRTISPPPYLHLARDARNCKSLLSGDWRNECDRRPSIDRLTSIWLRPVVVYTLKTN